MQASGSKLSDSIERRVLADLESQLFVPNLPGLLFLLELRQVIAARRKVAGQPQVEKAEERGGQEERQKRQARPGGSALRCVNRPSGTGWGRRGNVQRACQGHAARNFSTARNVALRLRGLLAVSVSEGRTPRRVRSLIVAFFPQIQIGRPGGQTQVDA